MICRYENKKEEEKWDQLLRENAEFKIKQIELENQILDYLKNSGEDILNDDGLINLLIDSKILT